MPRPGERLLRLSRQLRSPAPKVTVADCSSEEPPLLENFTAAEVAQHATRKSCWITIHGLVFDFTPMVESHPGGARGLLRHAGRDASDIFTELHSQSIFTLAMPFLIGRSSEKQPPTAPASWQGVAPSTRFWEGLDTDDAIPTRDQVLYSPFPHDRFSGTGLESFRFNWAIADRLLRSSEDGAQGHPPTSNSALHAMHRQKSYLGVLNTERDWLAVSIDDAEFALEMNMKRMLMLDHPELVYVTDPRSTAAEAEVLELAIEWLTRRYPTRYKLSDDGATLAILCPGYDHVFAKAEWGAEPLRLLGMICQEDFYLLQEQDLADPARTKPPYPAGENMSDGFSYDERDRAPLHVHRHYTLLVVRVPSREEECLGMARAS